MTVFVFTDFGGERLLGKARELSDSWGDKLVAFTSKNTPEESEKLISFGADETIACQLADSGAWLSVIKQVVASDPTSRLVIFPSNELSHVLMGIVYAQNRGRFYPVTDQQQVLDENSAAKVFSGLNLAFRKSFFPEKVMLCSLILRYFPAPFADSSRYGKSRSIKVEKLGEDFEQFSISKILGRSSSDLLTVLIGDGAPSEAKQLAEKLAEKYQGRFREYSGKIETVYGPCIAIEVKQPLRDLPEFKSELISLSRNTLPISSIADTAIVTPEVAEVIQKLISDQS